MMDVPMVMSLSQSQYKNIMSYWNSYSNVFVKDTYDDDGGDSSDDDDDIEVSIDEVYTVLAINSILMIVLLLLHYKLAMSLKSLYCGRNNHVENTDRHVEPFKLDKFLDWVWQSNTISWQRFREVAGLDAYMFLRFLRMCLVICSVSSVYGLLLLWPVYFTGGENTEEWYVLSLANVTNGSPRLWAGCIFMWIFSLFVLWIVKQELIHYYDLRLEFLGLGDDGMDPIYNYSLILEKIPDSLQSDKALREYFDRIFPGKVHSASVAMKVPDLQSKINSRQRVLCRLEKAHAYFEASKIRPSHRARYTKECICCGVGVSRFNGNKIGVRMSPTSDEPDRGERVDSIDYYQRRLALLNTEVVSLQREKLEIAEKGEDTVQAKSWIAQGFKFLGGFSDEDDDISLDTSAFEPVDDISSNEYSVDELRENLIQSNSSESEEKAVNNARPGKIYEDCWFFQKFYKNYSRDFVRDSLNYFGSSIEKVLTSGRSQTGFVTFTDLVTTTAAAKSLLSDAGVLITKNAPEPRDIIWKNIAVDASYSKAKKRSAGVLVAIGALLWAVPVAFIQAIATADSLSEVEGFEWLDTSSHPVLANFVNGYLPVVTLMGLILLLPIIFEWLAVNYEFRKTLSGTEESVMNRYFIYLLANIYVTVTSGSLWDSLNDIIDDPSEALDILAESLPTVVGYFVSFILTKILLGLPSTILRWGDLSRYTILRLFFNEKYMTQREIDIVYKKQVIKYGREYPNLLLVLSICFTYSCIAPIILPVGAIYFWGAFYVYKMQFLHVFSERYQGGGALFPTACRLLLTGLVGGQLTLVGFLSLRDGFAPAVFLSPVIIVTSFYNSSFYNKYSRSRSSLTLERARAIDEKRNVADSLNPLAYKQKILTEPTAEPLPYRREQESLRAAIATANQSFEMF